MNNKYDCIVVGAGNGGLSAAATVSSGGMKTLVLERHNLPGGAASSFVRGRFEFEPSLHELAEIGKAENPGTIRKMFDDYGIDINWHTEDHLFRRIVPGSSDALFPTGIEAFCDEMERQVPGCRTSVHALLELGALAKRAYTYATSGKSKNIVMMTKYADFLRLASATTEEGMAALGVPKKAQDIINTYWCYLGGPPDKMDFLTTCLMIYYYVYWNPGQPDKKSHQMSLALEDVIRKNGGEIWYNCEVEKLIIEGDVVKGVIVNGEEIRANHVIANVSPTTIMGKMLPDGVTPPEKNVRLANARDLAMNIECMYIGLNRSAEELGIKDYSTFILSDEDAIEQWNKATLDDKGVFIANCLNTFVPNASPEGTCTLMFTAFNRKRVWDTVKPEEYNKLKEKYMEEWVAYYEKNTGIIIRPYIEEMSYATSATYARYLNSPNGTAYGYQIHKWDNIITRMSAMDKEKMFKGMHITGAASENVDGYSLCYENGQLHGRLTLKEAEEEN